MDDADWLIIHRGTAPLILSIPHAGTEIEEAVEDTLVSPWLGRKDADWWVDQLYFFARDLDATIVQTTISRTMIDVNRPPDGASLYPGQATTDLCPSTSFDGEPLYQPGQEPDAMEVLRRRELYHAPYHAALLAQVQRLRADHPRVVLYDCHSIRSLVPRLFDGVLPHFNIGTFGGRSCHPGLTRVVEAACDVTQFTRVTNGRFKGGHITRHYGRPTHGVHAVQMELACRGYVMEPEGDLTPDNWPPAFDAAYAAPMTRALHSILNACIGWAVKGETS
ncbi:N-formylglutamate deformylase [Niveispirillum fermenti]|uniref:N-formylglutamate deformylase n=1 Tax=Niveispirillum fermenti TaxID=1233113 RepID=UPI003A89246F